MTALFELGFVETFVAMFAFAALTLPPFFEMVIAMIVFISKLFHSTIVASFSDCMVIVRLPAYSWFSKRPRKPPDKRRGSASRNVRSFS